MRTVEFTQDDGKGWDGEQGCELCAKEGQVGEVEWLGVCNCKQQGGEEDSIVFGPAELASSGSLLEMPNFNFSLWPTK